MTDLAAFARTHIAPRDLLASPTLPPDLWADMARAGLFRIGLPAEHGGDGGSYQAIAEAERILVQEGGSTGLAGIWASHQMIPRWFLVGFGTPAQQARWLPRFASGELTAGVAISEPKVGAHPKLLATTARREGDHWVLDGEKSYVTNGDRAGLYMVLAITAREGERKRYAFFLVPRDAPGLTVQEAETPPSMWPVGHVALRLSECRVPADALLGPEGGPCHGGAYEAIALPFRDAEDAIGTSSQAGNLPGLVRLLGAELPTPAPEDAIAELGALAGLAALVAPAAATLARSVDDRAWDSPDAQSLLIGLRQHAAHFHARATAFRDAYAATRTPKLDARLHSIQTSLSVARGPRAIRMARLGAAMLPK